MRASRGHRVLFVDPLTERDEVGLAPVVGLRVVDQARWAEVA